MFDSVNQMVGLDIGSKYIKGVELKKDGDADVTVKGFGKKKLDPELDLAENLTRFRSDQSFGTDMTCSGLSGRSVITRYLNVSEDELDDFDQALSEKAAEVVPFDIEGANVDYQQLNEPDERTPASGEGEVRVLLVAVKEETINEHADMLEEAGFRPSVVDVDVLALGNAYEFHLLQNEVGAEGPVGLVDIGAQKTLVHIMQGDQSQFSREFYMGGDEFTSSIANRLGIPEEEAEERKLNASGDNEELEDTVRDKLDDLCHEIHLSFDYFETQFDQPVERIYVSGGGSKIRGLEQMMQNVFNERPVFWDPLENFPMDLSGDTPQELREDSQFLVVATGLASRIQSV